MGKENVFDLLDLRLADKKGGKFPKKVYGILNLREKFGKYFDKEIHLNLVIIGTIFGNPLFKTLIDEGISLIDSKPVYQKLGYESGAIFSLNLTKLEKSIIFLCFAW